MYCSTNRFCCFFFCFVFYSRLILCAIHHIVQLSDEVCTCECAHTIMTSCTHVASVAKVMDVVPLD